MFKPKIAALKPSLRAVLQCRPAKRLLSAAARHSFSRSVLRRLNYPRVDFPNFHEAWHAAAVDRYAGHDTDAIQIHRNLINRLRPSDYRVLQCLNRIAGNGELKVLDFGGNVGNVFYSYRSYLSASSVHWVVVDLPAVIRAGQKLAAEKETSELHFADSIANLPFSPDVLLISGALHYWEGPISSLFSDFSELPPHLIINRVPVHPAGPAFVTVQQTETYAVPCIVRIKPALLKELGEIGYDLADEWPAPELSLTFTLFPDLSVEQYSGFYLHFAPASPSI